MTEKRCPRCGQLTKQKRNPGFGKGKGAGFENELLAPFTQWWGHGRFIPTRRIQTVSHADRIVHGDIACVIGEKPLELSKDFPFSIEAKKDEGIELTHLFTPSDISPLNGFWRQCCEDAARWDKIPLLVFSKNFFPKMCIFPERLMDWKQAFPVNFHGHGRTLTGGIFQGEKVSICTLNTFFQSYRRRQDAHG